MEIDKAIAILIIHNDHNPNFTNAERREAHQLGIEALKQIRELRSFGLHGSAPSLPDETED